MGEKNRPGWESWILANPAQPALQSLFFQSFMRDFVTGDPAWRMEHFSLERDLALARAKLAASFNADVADLSAYVERGGKLILYHGWSDAAIPPLATVELFERMRATLGSARTDGFSRLYMVPGMQHCEFGPGAWWFNPVSARSGADPQSDMAASLVQWVEKGVAPGALIGIRPVDPASVREDSASLAVDRTALLCPYPQVARYQRQGDPHAAQSWRCALETAPSITHSNTP